MTRPGREVPTPYRLRVAGHLDHHWSAWLGGLSLTHDADGTTCLTGVICDQAELHGVLTKIRDLGVTLVSVAVVDSPDGVGTVAGDVADGSPTPIP